nr:Transmembrane protease serine 13 [Ipomoea batatas]
MEGNGGEEGGFACGELELGGVCMDAGGSMLWSQRNGSYILHSLGIHVGHGSIMELLHDSYLKDEGQMQAPNWGKTLQASTSRQRSGRPGHRGQGKVPRVWVLPTHKGRDTNLISPLRPGRRQGRYAKIDRSPVSVTPPPSVYSSLGPSLLPIEFLPANTTPTNSQPCSERPSPVAPARGEQIPAAAAAVSDRPVVASGFSAPTSSVPNSMGAATPISDSMEAAAPVSNSMEAAAPTSDSMAAAATALDSIVVAATTSDSVVAATTHSESMAAESSRRLPTTASQATVGSSENQSIPLSRPKRQRRPNPKYFNDKFVNLTTSHPVAMSVEPRTIDPLPPNWNFILKKAEGFGCGRIVQRSSWCRPLPGSVKVNWTVSSDRMRCGFFARNAKGMFCLAGVYSCSIDADLKVLITGMLHDCLTWCKRKYIGSVYLETEDWREVGDGIDDHPHMKIQKIQCAEKGAIWSFGKKEGLPRSLGRILALEGIPHFVVTPGVDAI